jgi:hypothetical protein
LNLGLLVRDRAIERGRSRIAAPWADEQEATIVRPLEGARLMPEQAGRGEAAAERAEALPNKEADLILFTRVPLAARGLLAPHHG